MAKFFAFPLLLWCYFIFFGPPGYESFDQTAFIISDARSPEENVNLVKSLCQQSETETCACKLKHVYGSTSRAERIAYLYTPDWPYWLPGSYANYRTLELVLEKSGGNGARLLDLRNAGRDRVGDAFEACGQKR